MRDLTNADRLQRFMRALGRDAPAPGRVYFTGGATAVLFGWRETTVDIDLKVIPEQDGVLRSIVELKEALSINVELAAPDDFIPVPPGWEDRGVFIATEGRLSFFHFDLTAQALAKIERGHALDLADVETMFDRRLVDPNGVERAFEAVKPLLYRYPAIDPGAFERAVRAVLRSRRQ